MIVISKFSSLLLIQFIYTAAFIVEEKRVVYKKNRQSNPNSILDEPPAVNYVVAVRNVAYYLRNYKFNEWDRRYDIEQPEDDLIGYFRQFPMPPLKSLHWKVEENCVENFSKCLLYLHSVIEHDPVTSLKEPIGARNDNRRLQNPHAIISLQAECQEALARSMKSGLPFEGPIEKFRWRTSAAYYMCWYTMLKTPALTALGEDCDNYANCFDSEFGSRNRDPRANDSIPFACALYSFCPDPCCPLKHVSTLIQCVENGNNVCLDKNAWISYDSQEQSSINKNLCYIVKDDNLNFKDIMSHKWNITCDCQKIGFKWEPSYKKCIDKNECESGHTCDTESEDCLNTPGSYKCICKKDYEYNPNSQECVSTKEIAKKAQEAEKKSGRRSLDDSNSNEMHEHHSMDSVHGLRNSFYLLIFVCIIMYNIML